MGSRGLSLKISPVGSSGTSFGTRRAGKSAVVGNAIGHEFAIPGAGMSCACHCLWLGCQYGAAACAGLTFRLPPHFTSVLGDRWDESKCIHESSAAMWAFGTASSGVGGSRRTQGSFSKRLSTVAASCVGASFTISILSCVRLDEMNRRGALVHGCAGLFSLMKPSRSVCDHGGGASAGACTGGAAAWGQLGPLTKL